MIRIISYLLCVSALACGCRGDGPPEPGSGKDIDAVRQVLDKQVQGWNSGDLELYMQGYIRSDSLRFASGGSVRYGWQKTLDNYRRGYPDSDAMGHLVFSDVDIRLLSAGTALVFGAWQLQRRTDAPRGLFTLIMQKTAAGWRIIHDHTSSARD